MIMTKLNSNNKDKEAIRNLPKSLQAIEIVLRNLYDKEDELSSIRNVSDATGLSMRVVKNALIQLENFNQVKKVIEKNNVLPKWKITKIGRKVLKQANKTDKTDTSDIDKEELGLLRNIKIIQDIEVLSRTNKTKIESIKSKLDAIIVEISKVLGPVINLDPPNPSFENLISNLLKRLKYFKQEISKFPQNPLKRLELSKVGEKSKKYPDDLKIKFLAELEFFISMIQNQLTIISLNVNNLAQCLEVGDGSKCSDHAYEINSELRILKILVEALSSIKIDSSLLSEEAMKDLLNNKIGPTILREFMEIPYSNEEKIDSLKKSILDFVGKIENNENFLNSLKMELNDSIPLYALYQTLRDYNPQLDFTIDQLENAIIELADEGYISGIEYIQSDQDHYLKIINFKNRDISDIEREILLNALKFESFSLADMVLATGMKKERITQILASLTEAGILRYTKSFLHGEQWYVATAWNWNDKKELVRKNLEAFEKELRDFIKHSLFSYFGKEEWWINGIPEYVKHKIEDRMRRRQEKDPSADFELIDFLDFSDYFSIIFNNINWNKIFSKTFPDKRSLEYPLEKLRLIRNDVAHVHVNPSDLEKYPVYIDDIKKFFKN